MKSPASLDKNPPDAPQAKNAIMMEKVSFIAPAINPKPQHGYIKTHLKNILRPTLANPQTNSNNLAHATQQPHLLKEITCTIPASSITHIVGPSGCGKSTLARLFNRLNEPAGGKLEILGKPIFDWDVRQLRRTVAFVFQEPSLANLDVRSNLLLPFKLHHNLPDDIETRLDEVLELAGLNHDFLNRRASQLSGGQKHRIALARALITNPKILLLDEPTSSLDPPAAAALLERVSTICRQRNITLVIVTHRLSEVKQLGGNLLILIDGKLRGFGDSKQLLNGTGDTQVDLFLQGKNHEPN